MNASPILGLMMSLMLVACSRPATTTSGETEKPGYPEVVSFNSDSAFSNVAAQVNFGPRVPGTTGHSRCRDYIVSSLRRYGADSIIIQNFDGEFFTGETHPLTNIMAMYNPSAKRRILLGAHWDTRPWADMESSTEGRQMPIPGANDGGSGVAVLLELARLMSEKAPEVGVDLVFFDGEDSGSTTLWNHHEDSWCIGSQYWKNHHPYTSDNLPYAGIVLDMVGGKGARFHREVSSDINAKNINNELWDLARRAGYGKSFINAQGGQIIDDHLQINEAGIPCVVVIESLNPDTQSFNPTWHTQKDDMSGIDRKSLKAVGQTMANFIYEAK